MRNIPEPPEAAAEREQGDCDWFNANAQMADWKECPSSVLGYVDHLLKPYGLEVVIWDTGTDSVEFQVVPLEGARQDTRAGGAVETISVDVQTMRLSDGRADYFVRIKCGERSVTPHVFRERWKAKYEVAVYSWIFGLRPDEPDLMSYSEDSYPNLPATPTGTDDGEGA